MKKMVIVYDDSKKAVGRVKTILGEKTFGEMILKRQSMFDRTKEIIKDNGDVKIIRVSDLESFDPSGIAADTIFMHIPASSAVVSSDGFELLIDKSLYAKGDFAIGCSGKMHGAVLKNRDSYVRFLDEYKNQGTIDFMGGDVIETNIFVDLSDYDELLMFISGGFDARYFNSLQGDTYTVTKRSSDKRKMKKEYWYYWLLPEAMKNWMVMPYDYKEAEDWASYTMERMPMTDIAVRWTHGAVDDGELRKILDKIFYFFNHRSKKKVTKEEYSKIQSSLYIEKLNERIEDLKKLPEYALLDQMIKIGTDFGSIDEIVKFYKDLYVKVLKTVKLPLVSVIGHGDVFFANMLYSKELNLLRLIDPKGALKEEDLWTDPYYDIAKLSHSICGNYDFFNTGSYTINFNRKMKFELDVHTDNSKAKEIFQEYLEKSGYDYRLVRLYESSLFLSMLPLHIDNPHKVFAFILNAIIILKEIEKNVR